MNNNTSEPARKVVGRPFQKGADPRRHTFTKDECERGFQAALESIVIRYPQAVMPDGRHISCNFLRRQGGAI